MLILRGHYSKTKSVVITSKTRLVNKTKLTNNREKLLMLAKCKIMRK